jgi:heterodisulfide reductase subunit A-like polyferredoxin
MISRISLFARGPRAAVNTLAGTMTETAAAPTRLLQRERLKRKAMVSAVVVAEPIRCVECGICTFNCPLGIDVRGHVRQGLPVANDRCLTCGECVARCPRGTLRFEVSTVFSASSLVNGS